MPYQFNDDDKEAREFKERIPFGVTKVKLVGAIAAETANGSDYIELTVVDEAGTEETARCYFTEKAAKYSFDTIRQIAIHNASEANKEKARLAVEGVKDSEELADLLNSKVAGGELWFTKYYDPTRTYVGGDGQTRPSVNTNVYGYEPKLKPELMPKPKANDGNIDPNDFPPADKPGAGIPEDW